MHNPEGYVATNVYGTLYILQACREYSVDKVLVASTSEVYGTANNIPITEAHPRQPQSPYSATKIASDSLAESFYRSFESPVTIVRPFNTYGPRQSSRAIIPTIITQLLANQKQIHLGDLQPTRDFVYVKDTARGFIELAKSAAAIGKHVNIATGNEYAIKEVADKLIRKIRSLAKVVTDEERLRPSKSEVMRLCGSNDTLFSLTGWRPVIDFDTGLNETIEWYKSHWHEIKYELMFTK